MRSPIQIQIIPYRVIESGELVVTQHAFAVDITEHEITLCDEHDDLIWLPYTEARSKLTWDSDRTALWELNERLKRGLIKKDNRPGI